MKYIFIFLSATLFFSSCDSNKKQLMPQTVSYALRLKPGADLKKSITDFVKKNNIEAGWIASCAGSLTHYAIRFANMPGISTGDGHFEIVSLSGTVSENGSHLHISISDSTGHTIGGHLSDSSIVYTTAEIIIQQATNLVFTREKDGSTEWEELQIKDKEQK